MHPPSAAMAAANLAAASSEVTRGFLTAVFGVCCDDGNAASTSSTFLFLPMWLPSGNRPCIVGRGMFCMLAGKCQVSIS